MSFVNQIGGKGLAVCTISPEERRIIVGNPADTWRNNNVIIT